jgi:hypothetical protein
MAKQDKEGNIITAPQTLKKLYLDTYIERLKHRDMKPELMDIFYLKSELWLSRLQNLKEKTTPDWKMDQLDKVLIKLKNNKTMDPNGMVNEVFKTGCIGSDLKKALLLLLNGSKVNQLIPIFMTLSNITSIYNNKGSKLDLNNDRGIFILTVIKKILDNIIYLDKYEGLDCNMSDSNIGGRRKRNVKDHLLIIYGVINSVIKGGEECIDIQIYDLEKAFDALWLNDCLNDVYDTLPEEERNDKVALLYELNKVNMVAVKTAGGLTDRVNIPSIVQQGGTWGSMLCSNSIDTLGKKCKNRGENIYLYKNTAEILPLAFVDDLNGISKCGEESMALNTFITTQIELKKLKFHVPDKTGKSKCHKMHIGKKNTFCPTLKVHGSIMQEVTEDVYLGDIIRSDGNNTKNIRQRISKGIGIVNQIFNLLGNVRFGAHQFEIAMLLRESMLVNGILTNSEIWYNFTNNEVEEFSNLDRLFFRRLLGLQTTPDEYYYLVFGVIPINLTIKARRINYLHTILSSESSGMLYNFFITQWYNPSPGDWTEQVKEDLTDFQISLSFEQIKKKSKESFKNMVKTRAKEYSLNFLKSKQASHSKMEKLIYKDLKIENYLLSDEIEYKQKQTIFRFRTRMERFGENYRAGKNRAICPLCHLHYDSQELSLQCPEIRKEMKVVGNIEEIYNEDIGKAIVGTLTKITEIRKNKIGK